MLSVRYGRSMMLPPFYRVVGHSKMLLSARLSKAVAVSERAIL
jgi:hypothetical protein